MPRIWNSVGFILFITYLLPSRFLIKFQENFYRKVGGKKYFDNIDLNGLLTIIFGLSLVFILIIFETFIIDIFSNNFKKNIEYFLKTVE